MRFGLSNKDGNARRYVGGSIPLKLESVVPTKQGGPKVLNSSMRRICEACHIEMSDVRIVCAQGVENRPPRATPIVPRTIPIIPKVVPRHQVSRITDAFATDLMANCPNGFDFREMSRRLVEKRVGIPMSDAVVKDIQARMFERRDGLWLFPQMVMGDEDLKRMMARTKELLSSEGAFAMEVLRGEFEDVIRNIPDGADFKRFFNMAIAERVGGRVRGHGGWRVCFRAGTDEGAGWAAIAVRVRGVLEAAGDAISVADVLAQLPHLGHEVVLRVCEELLSNAIVFSLDEVEYVKLLEAFYLPEDFGAVLSAFLAETEADGGAVSSMQIELALDAKYGDGFRVNFGLEDEAVFKDVILKSISDGSHVWAKDIFVSEASKSMTNIVELFVLHRDGMFHEEEFFKFAEMTRGITNHDMLVRRFLSRQCVRMSKEWWMSDAGFDRQFGLTSRDFHSIGERLNNYVGEESFKSIAFMPEAFYETLPPLRHGDKTYAWNKYLLTSVGVRRIENAKVLNDGLSTYGCTAVVVPFTASGTDNLIGYVLKSFPAGYFGSADVAFEFLKKNNIRLAKGKTLMKAIRDVLGIV